MTVHSSCQSQIGENARSLSDMFACAHWGAVGEFAASRHGVITRKQAAALDLSRNVIARLKSSGHLVEPVPRVLVVVGSVDSWYQRLTVATQASNAAGVVGFRSAAALHHFDGFATHDVDLVVATWRSTLASIATLHVGPMEPCDITAIDGFRCTGVARTLCDVAAVASLGTSREAFESMWRAGHSLVWIRQTAERLHRPGQRGTGVILDLLDEAEDNRRPTGSTLELQLESCLGDVADLVRQFEIRDAHGAFVARADFAVPDVRVAIEAHSRRFHFGKAAEDSDEAREHAMTREGWEVIYVGSGQLKNPSRVRANMLAIIERRRADLGLEFRSCAS